MFLQVIMVFTLACLAIVALDEYFDLHSTQQHRAEQHIESKKDD